MAPIKPKRHVYKPAAGATKDPLGFLFERMDGMLAREGEAGSLARMMDCLHEQYFGDALAIAWYLDEKRRRADEEKVAMMEMTKIQHALAIQGAVNDANGQEKKADDGEQP